MRTIKFRAKRTDGETEFDISLQKETSYVYGSLFVGLANTPYYTIEDNLCNVYNVDEDSICQYTGYKDKNGKELYEGDTISMFGETYKIEYDTDACAFVFDKPFRNTDKHTPIGLILKDFAFQIEDNDEEK